MKAAAYTRTGGPDVLEYVIRARRAGAFTVAITNDPDSELAAAAEAVLPLEAGPELAVAATKTYLNQVGALGLLAAHLAGRGEEFARAIEEAAELLERHLPTSESATSQIAVPFASVGRMFAIGRGPEFATARVGHQSAETPELAPLATGRPGQRLAQHRVGQGDGLFHQVFVAGSGVIKGHVVDGSGHCFTQYPVSRFDDHRFTVGSVQGSRSCTCCGL